MGSQWEDVQGLIPRLVGPLRAWFLGYGSGYQEGTWTPAFGGEATPGSFTYAAQVGAYTRVGSLVYAQFFLVLTAIPSAPAGNLYVGDLPFLASADTNAFGYGFISWDNVNLTAGAVTLVPRVANGSSGVRRIFFIETYDNTAANFLSSTQIGATTAIAGNVIYRA